MVWTFGLFAASTERGRCRDSWAWRENLFERILCLGFRDYTRLHNAEGTTQIRTDT